MELPTFPAGPLDWLGVGSLMANMTTIMRGIPAFFEPNLAALRGTHASVGAEAAAYYSTEPLRRTLSELVDFPSLNDSPTRLTVGAVNACTGAMRYFDTHRDHLCVEHILASGALPPAFPAVRIDGEPYWDGGIYSNTPIEAVLDDKPRRDSLIFAVNVLAPDRARTRIDLAGDGKAERHSVREPRRQPHCAAETAPSAAPRDP